MRVVEQRRGRVRKGFRQFPVTGGALNHCMDDLGPSRPCRRLHPARSCTSLAWLTKLQVVEYATSQSESGPSSTSQTERSPCRCRIECEPAG